MKKILIIEDDADTLRNLAFTLEMEGMHPLTASNGTEGLKLARQESPNLIICDLMMPGMDGHGVLAEVRADPLISTLPFIFLTARGERQDLRTGMNLGADDYLVKPVRGDEVLEAIHSRLARYELNLSHAEFHPDFSSHLPLAEHMNVTLREAEVLLWMAQGKTNSEIALILGVSDGTVRRHLENAFPKLGIENRHSATLLVMQTLATKAREL